MGLVGPALTTISTKKRKEKITKAKQAEYERGWRDRNIRLKEMGLPKETLEQYIDYIYGHTSKKKKENTLHGKPSKKTSISQVTSNSRPNRAHDKNTSLVDGISIKSLDSGITGAVSSKPSPTYTGTKIIGISQMAKSNAVPVFNSEEIIDIARMRR